MIYQPKTYMNATKEEIDKVCNGCGADGGIKVPSTMYAVSIIEACMIHDWMYKYGTTLGDKIYADYIFLTNMISIISKQSKSSILKYLRMRRALKYYYAVLEHGHKAYWYEKDFNTNMHITFKGEYTYE